MDKVKAAYKWVEDAFKVAVTKGAEVVVQYPKTTVIVVAAVVVWKVLG